MATLYDLTTAQLRQAVQIREQIESLQEKLDALLGSTAQATKVSSARTKRQRRTMSAATRKKMAAAQKARWAKINSTPSTKASSKRFAPAKASPEKKVG